MFIFMSVSVTQNTCKGCPFLVGLRGIHHNYMSLGLAGIFKINGIWIPLGRP